MKNNSNLIFIGFFLFFIIFFLIQIILLIIRKEKSTGEDCGCKDKCIVKGHDVINRFNLYLSGYGSGSGKFDENINDAPKNPPIGPTGGLGGSKDMKRSNSNVLNSDRGRGGKNILNIPHHKKDKGGMMNDKRNNYLLDKYHKENDRYAKYHNNDNSGDTYNWDYGWDTPYYYPYRYYNGWPQYPINEDNKQNEENQQNEEN